jgi:hypothetical protein
MLGHQRGKNMKILIAAIVAVIISGCAGGLTGPQTASIGSSGKGWASDALEPKGGE